MYDVSSRVIKLDLYSYVGNYHNKLQYYIAVGKYVAILLKILLLICACPNTWGLCETGLIARLKVGHTC